MLEKGGTKMYELNKKQKIILIILASIIAIAICYYVYAKDESSISVNNEEIEVEETAKEDKKETEEDSSDIIMVHITGAVNNPGIIELKTNSRIADAIDKAGGVRDDANIEKINLAYIIEDGMKVYIPSIQDKEEVKNNNDDTEKYIEKDDQLKTNNNNNIQNSKKSAKININTATQTELEELPGIGPSIALKIIKYRDENGKFKTIEDIKKVSGVGDSKYAKIKDIISIK